MTELIPDFAGSDPGEYALAVGRDRLANTPAPEPEPDWDPSWGPDPRDDPDYVPPGPEEPLHIAAGIRDDPILARLGARHLWDIPRDPPPPLELDRLDPSGHTILFGPGGIGKGVLASHWAGQLAADGHRVLIVDYENHSDEWARRIVGLHGVGVLEPVLWVGPLTAAWTGRRGALWQQAGDLRALAEAWAASFVIVDSIVPACGATDPTKPEAASQYAGALELIGRPALSLAHVTKAEDARFPFGSVFWHNLARVTWSLGLAGDQTVMTNRKSNNSERLGRFAVTVTWRDNLPAECWERPYALVLADAIAEILTEPLTVVQIVEQLNAETEDGTAIKANSVRHALRRGLSAGRFALSGSGPDARWSVVE